MATDRGEKVEVTFEEIVKDGTPSLCATCSRCDKQVEVFGQKDKSRRMAGIKLREGCDRGETNFYVTED